MKNNFLYALFLLISTSAMGQVDLTWDDLAKIDYTEKYFPAYESDFLYPEFSKEIVNLQGKEVSVSGYYLDIDPNGELIILSKNPLASCFFCGNGGPETAIEIQFKSKPDFETDDVVLITGTLKLNKDDVEHFNYILTDCSGFQLK
ncbi:hypothetical protein [Zobellia galactanivorans]|uniref:Hypothetical periplasmic protein n=1 Tax=Zobellia galactanivorans (strain DSM 12802 / CCUG 47099 / CIP 106680 / NCIMB 13871 / Dsij) TaxID=63186 RepID=G0L6M1_ZOBGA|nr:hypothetical protein [Zobellia galactanivorans]CAZ98507.1 Hypothetical periplasmic protein [Zobellia galactanivorans]